MSDFLSVMAAASRERVENAKHNVPLDDIRRRARLRPKRPRLKLHASGFDLIAEIKRNAPSAGVLNTDQGEAGLQMVARQGDAYARGGAAAISVLTEPTAFSGDLQDLAVAARSVPVPIMRKDFLVDAYQIFEARAHDATGVLLIARMLESAKIDSFVTAAEETRQFILLELFDKEDMGVVEAVVNAVIGRDVTLLVGVNARNLETLEVNTDRFASLAPLLPNEFPLVAESGLHNVTDIRHAASLGYRVALVGTACMQAASPAKTVSQFVDAGRQAIKACASE